MTSPKYDSAVPFTFLHKKKPAVNLQYDKRWGGAFHPKELHVCTLESTSSNREKEKNNNLFTV